MRGLHAPSLGLPAEASQIGEIKAGAGLSVALREASHAAQDHQAVANRNDGKIINQSTVGIVAALDYVPARI